MLLCKRKGDSGQPEKEDTRWFRTTRKGILPQLFGITLKRTHEMCTTNLWFVCVCGIMISLSFSNLLILANVYFHFNNLFLKHNTTEDGVW